MKKIKKALSLNKETIKELTSSLANVHGGAGLTTQSEVTRTCQSMARTNCITDCYGCPIVPQDTAVCTTRSP